MLERRAIPGQLAPVMGCLVGLEKKRICATVPYWVGPVGRSDYWRDRSARDEKSQSIVVARIRNDMIMLIMLQEGPSHSSASILARFGYSGLVCQVGVWTPWVHSFESLRSGGNACSCLAFALVTMWGNLRHLK